MTDWRGQEWEKWGKSDPYFGVIAQPHLRSDRLDDSGRAGFFEAGAMEVAETLAELRSVAGVASGSGRALDFGCGVGRLTIPLARHFREVVGVDVSAAMLREARANCERAGIANARFCLSTPTLDDVEGEFDFVHSFIVFQHIPPRIGYAMVETLLDRLRPGGCGMLHFTYGRRGSALRSWAHRVRRSSRLVHRAMNLAQGRPAAAPLMAMFEYDLGRLFGMLEARGFDRVGVRLTNHGGWLGAMLAFSRTQGPAI